MSKKSALPDRKYHVALSFAGEDRTYVEDVANRLVAEGVLVFYDKFEEATLWGKNLYTHLRDVYENKALFTVMFVSEPYRTKLWTNHERESAQSRAFEENQEYILPAFFDEAVKVPGLLKTTGRISLAKRSPEDFADLIIAKLAEAGVNLNSSTVYGDDSKADIDFPRVKGDQFSELVEAMRTYTWPVQAPAVEAVLKLDFERFTKDQIFVLGRNLYQCADGSERNAQGVLLDLRSRLAQLPLNASLHLLNGMFYEVYFNREGLFRERKLKGRYLYKLLGLQTVKKFAPSIAFIRGALRPYAQYLPILPSTTPEIARFVMTVRKTAPPTLKSLQLRDAELLATAEDADWSNDVWKLSFVKFTADRLKKKFSEAWSIPSDQLEVVCKQNMDPKTEYHLPEDSIIEWPKHGIP